MTDDSFLSIVPPKYREAATVAVVAWLALDRVYRIVSNAGGLRGLWLNFFYGNRPKSETVQMIQLPPKPGA